MKTVNILFILLFAHTLLFGQQKKPKPQPQESIYSDEVRDLVIAGNDHLDDNAFAEAEASYREAVSLDPTNLAAKYNAGTNYYENEKWEESTTGLVKATEVAQTKEEKHKAFHNLGNSLYQQKNFKGAVEAYKNALRNNPTDEETRYNLALAKEDEEENGGGGGGGGGEDENQDQDQSEDQSQNQKNKDGEGDKEESEDGEEEETPDEGEEKENESEQKEDDEGKPKDKEQEQSGSDGEDKEAPPPQPREGQLSPQQVQSILEALKNQEQQTQDKINAQKVKGAKVKTEKDW